MFGTFPFFLLIKCFKVFYTVDLTIRKLFLRAESVYIYYRLGTTTMIEKKEAAFHFKSIFKCQYYSIKKEMACLFVSMFF